MIHRLHLTVSLFLLLRLPPTLSVDVPDDFYASDVAGCRVQEHHQSLYVTALLSQSVPSYGCVSRELLTTTRQQVDVLLVNETTQTSGHHRHHIHLTLKPSTSYDDSSKSVIYVLSSAFPVIWNVRGERFQDLRAEIWVSNQSRVNPERHLGLSIHKADLPSSLSELVSWTRRRFHAVTTLRSISAANSVSLRVGIDELWPERCDNLTVMSNAETFYLKPQNVKGCSTSDEPAPSSRMVHIIELVSAAPDHRGSGDMLSDVLVNLSSRSRMSSVRHVVLVLKAQSPVHWHMSIQRLHCSIDVITDRQVTSTGFTSEPVRVVAERLAAYSGRSLMQWTAQKYGHPQSYTLALLANQLQVNVDGKRRRRHGGRKSQLNVAQTLRQLISSSLSISCTDSWSQVTIPRSVLENYRLSSDSFSLANTSCRATANATHYILTANSSDCQHASRVASADADSVVHRNSILVHYDPGETDVVDAQSLIMINFSCHYPNQHPSPSVSVGSHGTSSDNARLKLSVDGEEIVHFPVNVHGNELLAVTTSFPADDAIDVLMRRCYADLFGPGSSSQHQLILPGCQTADNVTWINGETSSFQFHLSRQLLHEARSVDIVCDVSLCRHDDGSQHGATVGDSVIPQCISRELFCIVSNVASSASPLVSTTTLSVGPLIPFLDNKPSAAVAVVSPSNTDDDDVSPAACSEEVIVEGVSFAVVLVIAFAAFLIGVMLMSSLWFIYVKTSPKLKSVMIQSTDTSGDVTPSSTLGALTGRHVSVR